MKKNFIWSIDIDATNMQDENFRVTIWRELKNFTKTRIIKSLPSIHRLHRAQLRLASLPVEGWPWPENCKCGIYQEIMYLDELGEIAECGRCGRAINL